MADNVPVNPTASYTVAAEDVGGGVEVQQVKLLGGAAADTTGIGAGGTIVVSVTGPVSVSGAVSISAMPAVSGTVTVGNISTQVSGTVSVSGAVQVSGTVTIAPTTFTVNTVGNGLSVSAVVSGTVTVANIATSTTGSSGMAGVLVWLGASQSVLISTQISGTVTISPTVLTVNTVGNGLSVSAVVSGTVTVGGIAVSQTIGTIVTVLGTQIVSVVPGLSVSAVVSGTVTVSNGATVNVSGILITTTGVTTGTAQAVWIMNPTTVTVTIAGTTTGTVSISGVVPAVSTVIAGTTGLPVWVGRTVNTPFMMMVTSTAIAQSAAAYLFTVWTGTTVATAGVSLYVLPAGLNLQLGGLQMAVTTSAVVGGTVQAFVVAGTGGSFVSAAFRTQGLIIGQQIVVTALPVTAANLQPAGPVSAGGSIGLMIVASTAAVLQNIIIQGYLF